MNFLANPIFSVFFFFFLQNLKLWNYAKVTDVCVYGGLEDCGEEGGSGKRGENPRTWEEREEYEGANWELTELQDGSNFGKNPSRGQAEA